MCNFSWYFRKNLGLLGPRDCEKPPVHMMLVNQRNIVNPDPTAGSTGGGLGAGDLDGLSAAAGAAAPPLAPTHGPAAEALQEGAECDAETEDMAGASEAAAAAGGWPPRPTNWESMSKNQKKTWRKHGGRPR